MGKAEVVAEQLAKIQEAEVAAVTDGLGAAFDAGEADGNGPGFTQADIDAAVVAAVAPLNEQITKDAADLDAAHAEADAKLAEVQKALDDMTAKELAEEGVVQGLKDSVAAVQTALDAIKAIVIPSV